MLFFTSDRFSLRYAPRCAPLSISVIFRDVINRQSDILRIRLEWWRSCYGAEVCGNATALKAPMTAFFILLAIVSIASSCLSYA